LTPGTLKAEKKKKLKSSRKEDSKKTQITLGISTNSYDKLVKVYIEGRDGRIYKVRIFIVLWFWVRIGWSGGRHL
jgi:hypothetical protein